MKQCYKSLLLLVLFVSGVSAAPKPALVPGLDDWTVDVTFGHLQQISLKSGKENGPERFWYMIITLTNNTNRDVDFYPSCELMTDTFQIIPAGRNTPETVFEYIKKRHQKKYHFLESLEKCSSKLLQGEDNTKDIVIMWPEFDAEAKSIKIFITGLSNETVVVDHPTAKDENGNPIQLFLRKTLELNYKISGDPAFRDKAKLEFTGKRWIMR